MIYELAISVLNNNIILNIIEDENSLCQVILDIIYINNIDLLKKILIFINKSNIPILKKINTYFINHLINHPLDQLEQIVLNLSNLNNKTKKMMNALLNNNLVELINSIKFYAKNDEYYFSKIKNQYIYKNDKYSFLLTLISKKYNTTYLSPLDKNNVLIDLIDTNNIDILDGYLYYLKYTNNMDEICFDNIRISQNVINNINNICIFKKTCFNLLFDNFYEKIEKKME